MALEIVWCGVVWCGVVWCGGMLYLVTNDCDGAVVAECRAHRHVILEVGDKDDEQLPNLI